MLPSPGRVKTSATTGPSSTDRAPLTALARAEAARLRARFAGADPAATARALGVAVCTVSPSPAEAAAGIRAEYLADPPTIVVLTDVGRDLAIAHELFHHGQCRGLLPAPLCALGDGEAETCARAFAEALTTGSHSHGG
jgi:hypothetical protein